MKVPRLKRSKGFTLIEILVTVFIIGLVSTTLVVNWRKNEKQYQLQRAAQKIVQDIRKAQVLALSGKQVWDAPQGRYRVPDAFGISFKRSEPNSYIIFGDVIGNPGYQPAMADVFVESVFIESGIEIYSLSGGQSLDATFSVPDGFVVVVPTADTATIGIRRVNGICPQNCKNIIIRRTGQVNIQ